MGTRALVHFKEGTVTLATVYRQFDGYPTGLGADLKGLLEGSVLVNGFTLSEEDGKHHNGMGCLAATVVKSLKEGIGNVYLFEPNAHDVGEEFVYTILPDGDARTILLTVETADRAVIYSGPLDAFDPDAAEIKANS